MVTASFLHRISHTIDQIENRSQPRPWKVVTVPRGYHEDPGVARNRHYAAHPEDRFADILLWHFHDDKEQLTSAATKAVR